MQSTSTGNGGGVRGAAKTLKADAGDAVQNIKHATGQEITNLMADVQDLLSQVAHVADPDIARLRAKVANGLTTVRQAVTDSTDEVKRQTKDAINAGDRYVRGQPWQAVGIAALAGLIVGFLVARRR